MGNGGHGGDWGGRGMPGAGGTRPYASVVRAPACALRGRTRGRGVRQAVAPGWVGSARKRQHGMEMHGIGRSRHAL